MVPFISSFTNYKIFSDFNFSKIDQQRQKKGFSLPQDFWVWNLDFLEAWKKRGEFLSGTFSRSSTSMVTILTSGRCLTWHFILILSDTLLNNWPEVSDQTLIREKCEARFNMTGCKLQHHLKEGKKWNEDRKKRGVMEAKERSGKKDFAIQKVMKTEQAQAEAIESLSMRIFSWSYLWKSQPDKDQASNY